MKSKLEESDPAGKACVLKARPVSIFDCAGGSRAQE